MFGRSRIAREVANVRHAVFPASPQLAQPPLPPPSPPPTYFADALPSGIATPPAHSEPNTRPLPPALTAFRPPARNRPEMRTREMVGYLWCLVCVTGLYIELERRSKEFERRLTDQQTTYQKNLILNFNKYQQYKKQREQLFVKRDREHAVLEMKLSIHIGLLRQQALEAGLDPVSVEAALAQYERDVKVGTTLSNGSLLWVDDASPVRPHVPHLKDYDKDKSF